MSLMWTPFLSAGKRDAPLTEQYQCLLLIISPWSNEPTAGRWLVYEVSHRRGRVTGECLELSGKRIEWPSLKNVCQMLRPCQMDLSFTAEQTTVSWRPDPFAMATNQLGGTERICLSPICFNWLVPAEDQNRPALVLLVDFPILLPEHKDPKEDSLYCHLESIWR